MSARTAPSFAQQLQDRTIPVTESGCRIWIGYCDKDGYGVIKHNKEIKRAHRAAWEIIHGHIPDGLQVLHHCDIPPCTEANHLFLGTSADNMKDSASKGRKSFKKSAAHRKAISDAHKGKACSSEHRASISRALTGRKQSSEQIEAMRRRRWPGLA